VCRRLPHVRAAVYLRQSKDQNGAGLAVERQREDCLRLCRERGWEPAEYVDNDKSAYSGKKRPDYQRMLDDIEAGSLDAVVCWDLDRLHRRPIELEHFIDLADRHHLALATVSGDTDLGTDSGRLFARVKGAVARSEGERKSARQKRQGLQAAQMGKPQRGPRAFGYEPDGLTVRPAEAKALRAAYDAVLAGTTLTSLCRELMAAGFTTPRDGPFRISTLRAILLNPRNAGLRAYGTHEVGEAGRKRREPKIIGSAIWPAIVDEDTWRTVHALLTDKARRSDKHSTARKWLLGGIALCGRCGGPMTVFYRGRDANGGQVRTYRCRDHRHLTREASFCDWRVAERIIARLSRDDARDLLVDDDREDLAELRTEHSTLRMRLGQLGEDFADGTITRDVLHSGTERLRTRLADVEARMVHVDRAPLLADLVTAEDVRAAWAALGLDRKRAVIDLLYKVTLLPSPPGRTNPELESVRMEPKT
jgi:DNA invertase Pin-like site-specific DNA recombinase